jgi:hypothetical protein
MTVAADRQFTLQFDGALTMTHHATNLDLPGEANITTAAGDVATFQSTGSNTVQCINYMRADGTAVVGSVEGTAVLSTGEAGGTKYLREDGDGTSSWQTAGGNKIIPLPPIAREAGKESGEGYWSTIELTDNATVYGGGFWTIPDDFSSLTKVECVVYTQATGNMYADFGSGASADGEASSADQDAIAVTTYAVTANELSFIDISAAFNGNTLGANHIIGMRVKRHGAHGSDTIGNDIELMGWLVTYA